MTTADAFSTFKSELELTDATYAEASRAQQAIREKLSSIINIEDSFLSGSYARHTKIHPLKDIDIILVRNNTRVVPISGGGLTARQALSGLESAVRSAYPHADIERQSRSINVEGPWSFGFDLVPVWLRHPNGYLVPDYDSDNWIATDPTAHADLMTEANKATKGLLKPVVKMVKHWNANNHDLFRSFHIELICRQTLLNVPPTSIQHGVATVLRNLHRHVGTQMMDPIFGESRVDKILTAEEHTKLMMRTQNDGAGVVEALNLESAGQHTRAIEKWKSIFLAGFPR